MDKKEEFYELLAFCNSSPLFSLLLKPELYYDGRIETAISEAERIKCIVLRERRLKK